MPDNPRYDRPAKYIDKRPPTTPTAPEEEIDDEERGSVTIDDLGEWQETVEDPFSLPSRRKQTKRGVTTIVFDV